MDIMQIFKVKYLLSYKRDYSIYSEYLVEVKDFEELYYINYKEEMK